MESDNMAIVHWAYGLSVTRMYLPKMESDLLPRFHGNIGQVPYIKCQHSEGDSPSDSLPDEQSEDKPPQEGILPDNNQENAEEHPPWLHREPSKHQLKIERTRTRHPGKRSYKKAQELAILGEGEGEGPFAEKNVRRAFIRKVYLILTVQLGLTVGIICLFIYWSFLKIWVRRRPWFCYSLLPAILIVAIILACCDHVRRKVPLNYILLLVFTIFEGVLLGSLASFFDADGIMWAIAGTAFVTLGLSIFALQKKWDLNITQGLLLSLFLVVLTFGILSIVMLQKWLTIVYAAAGTLFFALYLVVDTQLMLGRTYHYRLNPDEYIFAALNVYIDMINMCLFLRQFVGFMK